MNIEILKALDKHTRQTSKVLELFIIRDGSNVFNVMDVEEAVKDLIRTQENLSSLIEDALPRCRSWNGYPGGACQLPLGHEGDCFEGVLRFTP